MQAIINFTYTTSLQAFVVSYILTKLETRNSPKSSHETRKNVLSWFSDHNWEKFSVLNSHISTLLSPAMFEYKGQ